MGKYSSIVNSKKESGLSEHGGKPENQKSAKVENNKTGIKENSQSGNQQSIKTRKPENQKTIQEDMVNLSIKVPKRLRQKWVAESRLRGTTLTAIISDYLKAELGE